MLALQECEDAAGVGDGLPEHGAQRPTQRPGLAQPPGHPPGGLPAHRPEDPAVSALE